MRSLVLTTAGMRYSRADVKFNAPDVGGQRVKPGGDTNPDRKRENDL
jgi:hypothetical protein